MLHCTSGSCNIIVEIDHAAAKSSFNSILVAMQFLLKNASLFSDLVELGGPMGGLAAWRAIERSIITIRRCTCHSH
jgi:hypothetical protein